MNWPKGAKWRKFCVKKKSRNWCKQKRKRGQANTSSDQTENGLIGKLFTKADLPIYRKLE
ncbi:MAG: hypothetical protein Sapg2KO_50710 [Saprospiraceae bacterium]